MISSAKFSFFMEQFLCEVANSLPAMFSLLAALLSPFPDGKLRQNHLLKAKEYMMLKNEMVGFCLRAIVLQ